MRAFRAEAREYCAYADWAANGARARFFAHIDTSGADLIRKARAFVAGEIGVVFEFWQRTWQIVRDRTIKIDFAFIDELHDHVGESRFGDGRAVHDRIGL